MDATIGNYKVRMEDRLLILTHPTGISFDLTIEEAIGLSDFLNVYRQTLSANQHNETTGYEQQENT